jgi:protein SCO1
MRPMIAGTLMAFAACFPAFSLAHSPAKIEFGNVDISDAKCCKDFKLTDDAGRSRSLADYRGKVVVLTFGFTRCPDVCPMTLATLKRAVGRLGPEGGQVQVLFVTLDPARDTGPVMRTYLDAFDPSFVGLRGNRRAVARTALDFRVFYKQAKAGSSANDYVIDHTLGSYVFDREGKPRVFVANDKIDLLVSDIRSLLHGPAVAQAPQTWR